MRIEIEPIPTAEFDADTIWQLAGFALSNCRIRIEFEDGDADGEHHTTRIYRHNSREHAIAELLDRAEHLGENTQAPDPNPTGYGMIMTPADLTKALMEIEPGEEIHGTLVDLNGEVIG